MGQIKKYQTYLVTDIKYKMGKRRSSTSRRASTKLVKKNKVSEKEVDENVESDQQSSQEEVDEKIASQQEETETTSTANQTFEVAGNKDESIVNEGETMDISTVTEKEAPIDGTFNVSTNVADKSESELDQSVKESENNEKESEKSKNIVDVDDFDATDSQLDEAEKQKSSPTKKTAPGKENLGIRSGSEVIKDLLQDLADMNRLITRAKNELHETRMKLKTVEK